jgi:hypothetical protein
VTAGPTGDEPDGSLGYVESFGEKLDECLVRRVIDRRCRDTDPDVIAVPAGQLGAAGAGLNVDAKAGGGRRGSQKRDIFELATRQPRKKSRNFCSSKCAKNSRSRSPKRISICPLEATTVPQYPFGNNGKSRVSRRP